jgi:hypothetical protein
MARQGTFRGSRREEAAHGTVVIDIGSSWTRMGIVGDASIRHCIATPRQVRSVMHRSRDEASIAHELYPLLTTCACTVPELLSSEKPPLVLVNASQNPLFTKVLLRWLHASCGRAPLTINTQLAALTSFGVASGVLLDVGWFSSRVCTIVGGVIVHESMIVSSVGWSSVIENCRRQFIEGNDCFQGGHMDAGFLDETLIADFVHTYGVVAPHSDHYLLTPEGRYDLQLKAVLIQAVPSKALETLFKNSDDEVLTISKLLTMCLRQSKSSYPKNIFLSGGPTLAPNFSLRLAKELKEEGFCDLIFSSKATPAGAVLAPVFGGLAGHVALS